MSEKTLLAQMIEELDRLLRQANNAEDTKREAEREVEMARREYDRIETEAKRLRFAIYTMEGTTDKTMADANIDNREQRNKMRKPGFPLAG